MVAVWAACSAVMVACWVACLAMTAWSVAWWVATVACWAACLAAMAACWAACLAAIAACWVACLAMTAWSAVCWVATVADRKSTRLNSSHLVISYAVFCLKKKKELAARLCVGLTGRDADSEMLTST